MMSLIEVAGRLNVSVSTVRRLIAAGRLKAVKVGRQMRVASDWIVEMLENNRSNKND